MQGEKDYPHYVGKEKVNTDYHHGQLPILPGVELYQIVGANRKHSELADGDTSTYKHAPDLAYFHGKFYVMYLLNPVDEHAGAGKSILASSADGKHWDNFTEAFPIYEIPACRLMDARGVEHVYADGMVATMHQRRCFYRAKNDRMLLLGFYGYAPEKWMVPWDIYGIGRVVRELYPDGSMGPIYFLLPNYQAGWTDALLKYPLYTEAEDAEFIDAVEELLANPLAMQSFAEENGDADDRIPVKHPEKGTYQAFNYYHLDDENVIGLWKHSFVARSTDGGRTFGPVVKEPSLVMSGQKIWGEKVGVDNYLLFYDPTLESTHRYPLAAVHSRDGIIFEQMRLIHGEVPPMRYAGFWKDFGPQYMRGIEEDVLGETDRPDGRYTYLTYSVNKEDIWIAHVPGDAWERETWKGLQDPILYQPVGAHIAVENHDGSRSFALHNASVTDYAKVMQPFSKREQVSLHFDVEVDSLKGKDFQLLLTTRKQEEAIWLRITVDGRVQLRTTAWITLFTLEDARAFHVDLEADCSTYSYTLTMTRISCGQKETREENVLLHNSYRFYNAVDTIGCLLLQTGDVRRFPNRETDPETYQDLDMIEKDFDDLILLRNLYLE